MIHPTDTTTLTVAASALRHAPEHMRTAHLADRLEEMAGRVRETMKPITQEDEDV